MADSGPEPSGLESLLFGERADLYRRFVRATGVVTVVLVAVYAVVRAGWVGLGAGTTAALGTAAGVAVAILVLAGLVEFVVLGRVYQRGTTEVAQTAAELEAAAEQLEETAEELETTADTVEDAADTVDEAATDVERTAEDVEEAAEWAGADDAANRVTEATEQAEAAKDKTTDAKTTAEAATEEAEAAKATANEVEETAAERRERLGNAADDGESDQ
ncbi:hypothetical protein [Haloarcula amylovorans]|uniref:hypothetical protein n=1 Tax=Haloarcula amylovorans TaxID=2562280 RepID=UPI001076565F|nr:hypothetical protein [Halomicroarcula amylolytica]